MKIKKVQLSEKDKRKAYRTAVRKASQEAGIDKVTRPKIYKNRKKYTRKGKQQIIREEEKLRLEGRQENSSMAVGSRAIG